MVLSGLATRAGSAYEELRRTVSGWDRAAVAGLVTTLADEVRAGRYPAGRPYRHVNGFTKVVVAEYDCGARLTLHIWPAAPGAPDDVSRPHDHRFPFTSILLGGEQRFVELTVTESGESATRQWRRYEYRPYLGGRLATVVATGTVGLTPLRNVARRPFDGQYQTSAAVIHQAVTGRAVDCATLVLRGPRERRTSTVFYRPGDPAPRGGLQLGRRLPHDEVVRQLDRVGALVSRM